MRKLLTFLLIATMTVSCMAEENETAVDFTLEKLSGGNFTLSDHKGKVIFIFIFGNTCPSCRAIGPSVQSQIVNEFGSNSNFLAIGIDDWDGSASSVTNFKNATGLTIPLLLKGSSAVDKLGSRYDRLLVIGADGEFAFKGSQLASTDLNKAKSAVQTALDNATTAINNVESENATSIQNYPNPFAQNTTIQFKLNQSGNVSLDVFDLGGRLVSNLVEGTYPEGEHQVEFVRNNLPSGIYLYQLNINGQRETKRMNIL